MAESDDHDDTEEDDDGEYLDCALDFESGQCGKAGSEECDWDCPHSHGPFYCGSEAWHRRQMLLDEQAKLKRRRTSKATDEPQITQAEADAKGLTPGVDYDDGTW